MNSAGSSTVQVPPIPSTQCRYCFKQYSTEAKLQDHINLHCKARLFIMSGMNYNIIEKTKEITNLPIIYCGGIGSILDIKNAFTHNISGVAAGSFFVFYGPHKAVLITYPHEDFEKL